MFTINNTNICFFCIYQDRDENRSHTDREKFEMECIAADGLSSCFHNEDIVRRIGLKLTNNKQSPFTNQTRRVSNISPVIDRRNNNASPYKEVIVDRDINITNF